jgi:two-component system sensor histidine kinase CpxA
VLELKNALWVAGGAVVLSVLIWLPFVSGVTRALGRLTLATERIADGRFDTRVPGERHDEIGELGVAINRMSSRLELLVGGQKRFLGDIAHELGSPLGRMQLGVGILEERVPPELLPAVADVREEVAHMAGLVAELLAFTRAGLLPRAATRMRVELGPLVARVLGREAAADAVALDLPAGLAVRADADLLARAVGNLLRNALRYAGREAAITLSARPSGSEVELVVEDTGPGVPPEALARLGEPFFRPEIARQRETGGAGLGLAIVRACIEACGGSVHLANRAPHGFRASMRLPLAD